MHASGDLSGVPTHLRDVPWSGPEARPDPGGDFEGWRVARAEWVAAGNPWPGGEDARVAEEFEAVSMMPDQIWNGTDL
jgi:hypothetical protein